MIVLEFLNFFNFVNQLINEDCSLNYRWAPVCLTTYNKHISCESKKLFQILILRYLLKHKGFNKMAIINKKTLKLMKLVYENWNSSYISFSSFNAVDRRKFSVNDLGAFHIEAFDWSCMTRHSFSQDRLVLWTSTGLGLFRVDYWRLQPGWVVTLNFNPVK